MCTRADRNPQGRHRSNGARSRARGFLDTAADRRPGHKSQPVNTPAVPGRWPRTPPLTSRIACKRARTVCHHRYPGPDHIGGVAVAEPTERWLPVVGYEGLYEVSDQGRVWSVPRLCLKWDGTRRAGGNILGQHFYRGYISVTLYRDGKRRNWKVHQLVATAFIGPRPPGYETRHGPGGRRDNRLVNLSYGTPAENNRDRIRDGTTNRGAANGQAKLTSENVIEIRRRHATGESQTALAREFGVTQQGVFDVVRRRRWRHIP